MMLCRYVGKTFVQFVCSYNYTYYYYMCVLSSPLNLQCIVGLFKEKSFHNFFGNFLRENYSAMCIYTCNVYFTVSQTILSVELPIPTSSPAVVSVINSGTVHVSIHLAIYVHKYMCIYKMYLCQ